MKFQFPNLRYYICALTLPLIVHPSWTWIEYCRFQRTSSIEGRLLDSLHRQGMVISTVVFNDWYAKVPSIEGSTTLRNCDGVSVKTLSSCEDEEQNKPNKNPSLFISACHKTNLLIQMHTWDFISSSSLVDLTSLPVITWSNMIPNWKISSFSAFSQLHVYGGIYELKS